MYMYVHCILAVQPHSIQSRILKTTLNLTAYHLITAFRVTLMANGHPFSGPLLCTERTVIYPKFHGVPTTVREIYVL